MTHNVEYYGYDYLADQITQVKGRLVVLEGTDGVGRSTQVALLREWLEGEGYAVATTGQKRGKLAGKGLKKAMSGTTMGERTMNLLYATDLADRLEREIVPALRAGFVVLTDRYIYSLIVRAIVRGADPRYMRKLYSFAMVPDRIFYLHADVETLVPRVLDARGFDYWESGIDMLPGRDYYDNFTRYQRMLLAQFDAIADEYDFIRLDANRSIQTVFHDLQTRMKEIVVDMKPSVIESK